MKSLALFGMCCSIVAAFCSILMIFVGFVVPSFRWELYAGIPLLMLNIVTFIVNKNNYNYYRNKDN